MKFGFNSHTIRIILTRSRANSLGLWMAWTMATVTRMTRQVTRTNSVNSEPWLIRCNFLDIHRSLRGWARQISQILLWRGGGQRRREFCVWGRNLGGKERQKAEGGGGQQRRRLIDWSGEWMNFLIWSGIFEEVVLPCRSDESFFHEQM